MYNWSRGWPSWLTGWPVVATDMEQAIHRGTCSWTEIKDRLDPAWSYVVIETTAATPSADVFSTVTALLAEHVADAGALEICREASSGNLLMLVQIDPDQTEAVKRKLLDPKLPPLATVYFYDCCPPGNASPRVGFEAG